MSSRSLAVLGAVALGLTGVLFAVGGILAAVVPEGGLATPAAPLVYYVGLVLSPFAFMAAYWPQVGPSGRLGLVGFVLSALGAVLYSAAVYALVAGTISVPEWHNLWAFAMGNVLGLGGTAFLLGMVLLGVASVRAGVFPKLAGILLAGGAGLWLLAFWGVTILLMPASLIAALGMMWFALTLVSAPRLLG